MVHFAADFMAVDLDRAVEAGSFRSFVGVKRDFDPVLSTSVYSALLDRISRQILMYHY